MSYDDYGDEGEGEEFPACEALRQTAKAVLVRMEDGRERWVPQSQIHPDSEVWKTGDVGTLVITAWLAERWDR